MLLFLMGRAIFSCRLYEVTFLGETLARRVIVRIQAPKLLPYVGDGNANLSKGFFEPLSPSSVIFIVSVAPVLILSPVLRFCKLVGEKKLGVPVVILAMLNVIRYFCYPNSWSRRLISIMSNLLGWVEPGLLNVRFDWLLTLELKRECWRFLGVFATGILIFGTIYYLRTTSVKFSICRLSFCT